AGTEHVRASLEAVLSAMKLRLPALAGEREGQGPTRHAHRPHHCRGSGAAGSLSLNSGSGVSFSKSEPSSGSAPRSSSALHILSLMGIFCWRLFMAGIYHFQTLPAITVLLKTEAEATKMQIVRI